MALVLIIVSFYYTFRWYDVREGNRFFVAVTRAIAAEHLRPRPLAIESRDPAAVLNYFDGIDALRSGDHLRPARETLLGGVATSLDGYPAIQLRYLDAAGHPVTRYVAAFPPRQLAGLPRRTPDSRPQRMLVDGVAVTIWREHGLALAVARRP